MKEVKFKTEKDGNIIFADSPAQLQRDHPFVGCQSPSSSGFRYMIIKDSSVGTRAIRPNGEWTLFSEGTFYVFDTQKELLCWMAEGRE